MTNVDLQYTNCVDSVLLKCSKVDIRHDKNGYEVLDFKIHYNVVSKTFTFIHSLSTKQTFKNPKKQLWFSEHGEIGLRRQFYLGNNNICFCTNAIICYFRLHLY